ncbi:LexA family transcriptional regulator [Phaeobacter sp. HF9A]|uniref:XRE family transcriptional regulator n=1 Tax=Phaeobacter sp. HF9A TaxID=2721561 RepID=UPI001431AD56|nr:LexA family transcriptional regulator [Phaeobacter sp. HF9A]NIZ13938.1 helix-turn-helix domain-containing protein [Phaeobacter sp. HF9A]
MGIPERIREIASSKSLTIKDISEKTGIKYRTIQNYLSGDRSVGTEFLTALSEHLGVSASWILTGQGDAMLPNEHTAHSNTQFISIPRLEVEASAGNGAEVLAETETHTYAFHQEWLTRRGLKPATLSVISVRGDSMEPELNDGDLILIDRANTDLSDGKIYAVHFSGQLFVKRIQYVPGDSVRLISSNPHYAPIEIKNPEADGVRVVGRVVASMHEW